MGVPLSGRASELERVDETIAGLPGGPRVLAIEGEAGIGKTTLWREGTARAHAAAGAYWNAAPRRPKRRSEFAGLGDLLGSVDGRAIDSLPEPQRHALEVALLRERPDGRLPHRSRSGQRPSPCCGHCPRTRRSCSPSTTFNGSTSRPRRRSSSRFAASMARPSHCSRPSARPRSRPSLLDVVEVAGTPRLRLGPLDRDALHGMLRQRLGDVLTPTLLGRIKRASRGNPSERSRSPGHGSKAGCPSRATSRCPSPTTSAS